MIILWCVPVVRAITADSCAALWSWIQLWWAIQQYFEDLQISKFYKNAKNSMSSSYWILPYGSLRKTFVTNWKCYYLFFVFIFIRYLIGCEIRSEICKLKIDKCTLPKQQCSTAVHLCCAIVFLIDWTGPFLCTLRTLDFISRNLAVSLFSVCVQTTVQHYCCWWFLLSDKPGTNHASS